MTLAAATAAAARNYLPRQRYRLSRQIARRVSRHFVVPLLSFLIRRRDKRGRAGPGRSVLFRTDFTIATWSIFAPRDRRSRVEILFLRRRVVCGDERDRYARRSVAAKLNETKRERREARRNFLRPFNRPRRTFFEFSARFSARPLAGNSGPVSFRSFSFAVSVKRAKTRRSPCRSHTVGDFQRVPTRNPFSRKKILVLPKYMFEIKYIGEISTFPFELCIFAAYWIFVSITMKIYWIFIFTHSS